MKKATLLLITLISTLISFSQNVGISNVPITPDPSALLEIRSTSKGMLIPRMNNAEMLLITAPVQGLMIYNIERNSFFYYDAGWKEMGLKADNVWEKNAANIYNSNSGLVGIGTNIPTSKLEVVTGTSGAIAKFSGGTSTWIEFRENNVYRGYLGSFSGNPEDMDFGASTGGRVHLTIGSSPKFSIAADGTAQVLGSNLLELGGGVAGKEANAGKIGYNAFGKSGLVFTGAGTTISNRAMFFYAEGGTTTNGPVYLTKAGGGSPTIDIKPTETGVDGAEILLRNGAGLVTIEIDADYGDGDGRVITNELQITGGSDLAEHFDINEDEEAEAKPGMLVSINTKKEGELCLTKHAGDKKIVGVISGANGIKPGMLMGQAGTVAFGKYPVALAGRVYVLATNEAGEILSGDFLTSSGKKGYAKKVTNISKNQGAIIGKAMGKVDPATGYVLVLINLQ